MKVSVIKIAILVLKIIYAPMKLFKAKNKIVYISRQTNNETLDFKLLRLAIENKDKNIKNIVLTKRIEKGLLNSIGYIMHMFKQMYHIATSKVVILDSYCIVASVLKHKKGTKIIQIWHAMGAIKKFGYQTLDKPSGSDSKIAKVMRMHKNYDFVLCPSNITKNCYCKAFNVDKSTITYIGMPRIDYILEQKDSEVIYKEYPELKGKENILYIPTFRKGKKIKLKELIESIDTNKYNLIIKLHPLDSKNYTKSTKPGIIFEDKFTMYDLIPVTNKIITDYSSLSIEMSLLEKPIYFYTYDIDEYKNDPGLNIDFTAEPIGKYLAKTSKELTKLLEEEYDYSALKDFKDRYITINTNNCAEQLADFVLRLMEEKDVRKN